ncbi:UDP-N-acetylglucosamine 2-epimerase (non-hydrolyzing) [bacterium]|nr:MAG: UDP-N-acetylglucosamine 2-epimerase (non-hydrolyzing) [bacterium]
MKIFNVVGARPNFMKISPLLQEMKKHRTIKPLLIHTGQHFDNNMSDVFFRDLKIPKPDIHLGVSTGTQAEQTAKIMVNFEKTCLKERPDLVVVVGDVNSTLACSLTAAKLCIPLAHVEAGLRSFDRTMPEEINRVITDALSNFLFTTCKDADRNLLKEGIPKKKIHFVGNVMIDTLLKFKSVAMNRAEIKIKKNSYAIVTLHRPSNVDNEDIFKNLLEALVRISKTIPIIFPAHPRTQKQIKAFDCEDSFDFSKLTSINSLNLRKSIHILNPLPYLEFLNLMSNARLVFTDSGGIQEETTILGIPCLTIRENTERSITIKKGTNILVGTDSRKIIMETQNILSGKNKSGKIPRLWDGKAAERIVKILLKRL